MRHRTWHSAWLGWSVLFIVALSLSLMTHGPAANAAPAEQQAHFALPRLVVNTSFLHVRTGPGVQYAPLFTAVGGSEFPVLAIASDRVWYLVGTPAGNGWVNVEFTLARGDFRFVPEIDLNRIGSQLVISYVPVPVFDGQGGGGGAPVYTIGSPPELSRARLNVNAVNLRVVPEEDTPYLTILFRNDDITYPIVGRAFDSRGVEWLQLDVPGVGVGWADAPKFIILGPSPDEPPSSAPPGVVVVPPPQLAVPIAIVNTGALHVRSGPGAHFDPVITVPGGTQLNVLALASDNVWYLVEGGFGRGWINGDFVIFRGVFNHIPVIDINP